MVLEKTLESPLDCKEIQPVNPKGNQPRIFSGRTDAESPILWPPDGKSQLIGEKQKQKQKKKKKKKKHTLIMGNIEGRSRRCDRGQDGWMSSATQWNEFEQASGNGDGQGSLAYVSS